MSEPTTRPTTPPRVYLHVEAPMFRAALDVRGDHETWGRKRSEVEGAWGTLCQKARTHPGTTVLSHELLAAASARQVASAKSMLAGLDVHVVVTARDLARQITAEWQEGIKNGAGASFDKFRSRILSGPHENQHAQRFWAAQDLPEVLSRWASHVPAANVHVVCCPAPHADPGQLWRRFADVVGFDPDAFDPRPRAANSSLGVAQIDLLRRVNSALEKRLVQPGYGRVVKQYFVNELLTQHGSARPELPLEMYDDLVTVGERWVKEIDRAGYTVHGDPTELVPTPPLGPGRHPDDVDTHAEVKTASAVVADLLVEVDRLRSDVEEVKADEKSEKKQKKREKKNRKLLKRKTSHARG